MVYAKAAQVLPNAAPMMLPKLAREVNRMHACECGKPLEREGIGEVSVEAVHHASQPRGGSACPEDTSRSARDARGKF